LTINRDDTHANVAAAVTGTCSRRVSDFTPYRRCAQRARRRAEWSEEATMFRLFNTTVVMHFWASPHHSMNVLQNNWFNVRGDRSAFKVKVLDPGFPRDDPPETPPSRPVKPIPTDVPVPEPRDVPIPEPIDVPPPEPGKVPPAAKPPKRPDPGPKPRPVP
jgi:hypothetical protein